MNRTEYKNKFYKEHYDRIPLAVPKGMKDVIKQLAADKGMSVNAYIQTNIRKEQQTPKTQCFRGFLYSPEYSQTVQNRLKISR